jgi:hypothetical protein
VPIPSIEPVALRRFVYDEILTRGKPPTSADIGTRFDTSASDVRLALAELRIGKTILIDPHSGEIWMAGPFSTVETGYRVVGARCAWWANCAWDMFGIAMIANQRVRVETQCTDCLEPIGLVADPSAPPNDDGVIHFLVPARRWYDDIGFT